MDTESGEGRRCMKEGGGGREKRGGGRGERSKERKR